MSFKDVLANDDNADLIGTLLQPKQKVDPQNLNTDEDNAFLTHFVKTVVHEQAAPEDRTLHDLVANKLGERRGVTTKPFLLYFMVSEYLRMKDANAYMTAPGQTVEELDNATVTRLASRVKPHNRFNYLASEIDNAAWEEIETDIMQNRSNMQKELDVGIELGILIEGPDGQYKLDLHSNACMTFIRDYTALDINTNEDDTYAQPESFDPVERATKPIDQV
ncbi:hypothetical protein HOE41_02510 [Candidatus Woesearchaeota archaeon]|jgi:hypothetical protein|nr:hypothetical protein [Candidatus Woesearchaeota archaeon]